MSLHWYLIRNEKSLDDRRAGDALHAAMAALREHGVKIEVRVSAQAADVGRHVAEAIAGHADCIIAAGGDGSFSALAAALAERDCPGQGLPAIALVPMGTANDFAEAAGIPAQPEAALELVRMQPPKPLDLLRIEANGDRHWCANVVTGGFGTSATVGAPAGLKRVLGGAAYLVTAIAELESIRPEPARIRGPDFDWQGDFIVLGVGNGRQAGGGQALCPDALADDGQMDVTIIPDLSSEVGATIARLLTQGKHATLDHIATRTRVSWIKIESLQPITLNLDGEPLQSSHFRIECVPARLRMHLPSDCPLLTVPGNAV